jgi:RNA polymerase sigma-70 factor, ECF subfamily
VIPARNRPTGTGERHPGEEGACPDDDAGFPEFFHACWPRVYGALAARTSDRRFIDDVAQEALLKARTHWPRLRDTYDKPELWVITVAIRLARRLEARERNSHFALGDNDMPEHTLLASPDLAILSTEHQVLYSAIHQLPTRRAEAIIMRMLGYSVYETAEVLGLHTGTVKSHLFHGRRDLRHILEANEEDGHGGGEQ